MFILYVADQARSRAFYASVLGRDPDVDVPGMTEFRIGKSAVLGLMPEKGIKRLLGDAIPDPASASGTPRAELYLTVDDPQECIDRAIAAGATPASPLQPRDWGDTAGYVIDPDGHVVAFAGEN